MAVSDEAFEELQRRVGTLEDDVRLTKRATADMDRDLSDFRATNRAVLQSLNALRETQIEHGRRLDGIDQRLDVHDRRFDAIDQRFDGIDQRFDAIDQRFDGIDQRFDGIDQRFDGIDQRFDGMDHRFEGQDGLLRQILRLVGGEPSEQGSR